MLKTARSYEEACRTFRWRIPDRYNLAFDVCDRQTMAGADGHRTALIVNAADGSGERYTFHMLRLLANRLANVLQAAGIGRGDRVLVSFPASLEAAVAVLAVTRMGAVAVPVPVGFGTAPVAWRAADCGAKAAVVAGSMAAVTVAAAADAPLLGTILAAGEAPAGASEMWAALERAADSFAPQVTAADDAALLFYPADAVGQPLGALHAHRALPGNLPAVEFALGFFAQFGDVLWTAADWMSFEGLMWGVLPAWHHGVPVVADAAPFEPERALGLMARHGVRAAFLPPAALAELTRAAATIPHPIPRALATGPEPLSAALHAEVERIFAVSANEIWGVRETGALAANNAHIMERRIGSPGRAVPGVTVEAADVLRARVLRAGDEGILAAAPGTPGAMLGYWGADDGERGPRLANGWMPSGWVGMRDLDGYLWPEPAPLDDGVVMVDGRRVALADIEATLVSHSLVAEAAVLALPLATGRVELRAFVVAATGFSADPAAAHELQAWVAAGRAEHEVPHKVEFVGRLPRAADGTIGREELASRPLRLDAPSIDDRWTPHRK